MAIIIAVQNALRGLYSGRLKAISREVGLHPYLQRVYTAAYTHAHRERVEVTMGGASAAFHVSNASELGNIDGLRRERRAVIRLLEALRDDDVFWDVGACIGAFSCLVSDELDGGQVVCFEPFPRNARRLEENLELNAEDYRIETRALADRRAERTFYLLESDEPGARYGSIESEYVDTDEALERLPVQTGTGDALVSDGTVPQPNVVKIDVEGAAPRVIEGMDQTLRDERCRLLLVEPHGNTDRLERMLRERNFRIEREHVTGSPRLFATNGADTPNSRRTPG